MSVCLILRYGVGIQMKHWLVLQTHSTFNEEQEKPGHTLRLKSSVRVCDQMVACVKQTLWLS